MRQRTRIGVLVVLMVGLAAPAGAQRLTEVGVQGGMNSANWSNAATDLDRLAGMMAGGFAGFSVAGNLGVRLEALYTEKGIATERFGSMRLEYVEVPLLVTYALDRVPFRPGLFAGPTFAREIACTERPVDGPEWDCDAFGPEARAFDRKTDIGVAVGGGVRIPLSAVSLLVEGRYTQSVRSIDSRSSQFDQPPLRNNVFSVVAGIAVPVGGRDGIR